MIVSDIMTRIKRQFGDESGVQVTDADIVRWINDGQRQIVMQNEGLLEKTVKANATIATQDYAVPVDMLILRSVSYKDTGQVSYFKLRGYSLTEFTELIDGWDEDLTNKSSPVMYTVYAGKILIFPVPLITITDGLKVYYNRSPVDVVDSSSSLDLPVLYHELLVKYCLQQAYEMDEDWEAANTKASELTADINILRDRDDWKQRETYPVVTIREEDM